MRKISIAFRMVLCGAFIYAAHAEEPSGAAGAAQAQQPSAAGATDTQQPSGAAGGAHPEQHPGPKGAGQADQRPTAPAAAHAADPAYMLKLAAAVRAHVPANAKVGAGKASCSFLVTANGSTSGINCKGSSPAHSQLLQRAILSTKAPPPPGGSFSASQSVVFH